MLPFRMLLRLLPLPLVTINIFHYYASPSMVDEKIQDDCDKLHKFVLNVTSARVFLYV